MKRKTCFYKCIVAFVVMICSAITMSAQTKVTSASQLKAGCVIKIYPTYDGEDLYGDSNSALACSGDGQPLDSYEYVGSGDEWTLEDAGDGSCYVKNNNGCYWAYQGSSDNEEMKCTIDKSSAVKVRLTWDSKNGGVCFWNDIDGSGFIDYMTQSEFYWWAYPNEYENEDYDYGVFEIALLKEGSGSDFVQKEMTTVVDGIKYSLDAKQKTAKVIAYNRSYSGDIVIPTNVTYENVTYKVNALGFGCFAECEGLTSVKLPSGITSLGGRCFEMCESLRSVSLRDGITSLGNHCFADCNSLTSVDLPSGITSLGEDCFSCCSSLTNIDLSCITSLGAMVLAGCSNLKNVKLPSGITSLGANFFYSCSSLESIDLPSYLTSLGYGCFSGCSSLESIDLPSCLTSLGDGCFRDCSSLTNISLPLGLTTLEGNSTPEDTDMGYGPDGEHDGYVLSSSGCFSGCSSLKSINLPSGITSLGEDCFSHCRSLKSINLPSGITSLGEKCFFNCSSLESIELPKGVTSLGGMCFSDCTGLATIYMYAEQLPTMGSLFLFYNCDDVNCILYVPKGTIDMYRQSQFGYFKNILELDATGINNPMTSTNLKEVSRYTVNGKRLTTPTKGVNVVKYSNGMVKKELVK